MEISGGRHRYGIRLTEILRGRDRGQDKQDT